MIIDFSELTIQFHRLAPGAVLISPNDARYMKLDITPRGCWVPSRPTTKSSLTNSEMRDKVGRCCHDSSWGPN